MKKPRYTVCIDFDGVIHQWSGEFRGEAVAEGEPVPGAIEALHGYVQKFQVCILSTRNRSWRARRTMRAWLKNHSGNLWYEGPGYVGIESVRFPTSKPPALIYIDDRAHRFDGKHWPTKEEIHRQLPWWKELPRGL